MQYRYDKEKNPVSMLAYGCMRFTKENGKIAYHEQMVSRLPDLPKRKDKA